MLSFIYLSNRLRSIDLLAQGLLSSVSTPGWELIVVDGAPGRMKRGKVVPYLKEQGIPVGWYGLPKPKTFPWSVTGFANAMNTGLLHAKGEHVVFVHDYTVLRPGCVREWQEAIKATEGKTLIHGSAQVYRVGPPNASEEDIETWEIAPTGTFVEHWVPKVFEVGYFSAPMTFFELTNGIDERSDFCSEWTLASIMAQAKHHNYKLVVKPELVCDQVDHRVWSKGADDNFKTWGHDKSVEEMPVWTYWSANPYNFIEERHRLALAESRKDRTGGLSWLAGRDGR